ncbi:unnamed protein product [Symbiodinium pilosum]|uniref:Uncharacterized protein n=1 Tax=Symbiodinium pilosum TaxID=2952 RepID=A0A812M5U8_SYMPI|nr:unnamed protein product [Symbiodinium pilosum]
MTDDRGPVHKDFPEDGSKKTYMDLQTYVFPGLGGADSCVLCGKETELLWKNGFSPSMDLEDDEKVEKHAHCRRFSAVPMGDDEPDPSSLEIVLTLDGFNQVTAHGALASFFEACGCWLDP